MLVVSGNDRERVIPMATYTQQSPVTALALRIGWGRNSLRRPVDRIEAVLVVLVWLASGAIALRACW
jgi:hypothetical protein